MSKENKDLNVCGEMEDVMFDVPNEVVDEERHQTADIIDDHKCTVLENLDNDDYRGNGKFFLVSSISSENILNCNTYGIKIRGFEDKEETSKKKAEMMRKRDKYHDVLVGSIGDWHSMTPSSSQIEEEKYGNEKLGKIMKKVHETEKKEGEKELLKQYKEEDEGMPEYDIEEDIIKTLSEKRRDNGDDNDDENDNIVVTKENFMFNDEDCLDEDPVIPDKRFAIISFASPELLMNVKDKLFKIRGFTHSQQKALQMIKKLEETDKTFNITIIEVGKWTPINFKLISKMRKYSDEKKLKKQMQELQNLNEIVGRYKKNIDSRKEILEKRKREKIKQAAAEMNDNDNGDEDDQLEEHPQEYKDLNENKESSKARLQRMIEQHKAKKVQENGDVEGTEETKGPKSKHRDNSHLNRNSESIKERLRRKLAERKKDGEEDNLKNKKNELNDKQVNIRKEAVRITEKKQNLEELKEDKEKLESKLQKMKELYAKKMEERGGETKSK